MTIEMLVGGFLILMMVAVIVISMTSAKSSGDVLDWDTPSPKNSDERQRR